MLRVVRQEYGRHQFAASLGSAAATTENTRPPLNYYEHHIGDYQRKTAHLTLAEHGAYMLMLQTFYATERPLPADRKVLHRLLRADSIAEKKAVESVCQQFWQVTEAGLVNRRAEEVIETYRNWVEKQRSNGSRGGRPSKSDGKPNGSSHENPTDSQTKANGGDRARVPLPTPHLDSPSRLPNSNPLTPLSKGASLENRSDREIARAGRDEATSAWNALLASHGAKRDARVQAAIDAVGGWSRIQQREAGVDANIVRKQFCEAYREAAPA